MLWLALVVVFVMSFLWITYKNGPNFAIAVVVPATWLIPSWVQLPLLDSTSTVVATGVDVKVAVGIACLILYCFLPGKTFPWRLVPTDFAMLGLVCTHLISDLLQGGLSWLPFARSYAEWYLPYVLGRLAFQSSNIVSRVWFVPVIVGVLFASASAFESWTGKNPFELIFGSRPWEGASQTQRWGIFQAFGPTLNPIYNAVVQLLLSGWSLYFAWSALRYAAPRYGLISPVVSLLGLVACASRAVLICNVIAWLTLPFFLRPKWRVQLLVFSLCSLAIAGLFREPIIQRLEQWAGEDKRNLAIEVDGEKFKFSNVRARLLLFEVNKIAFKRSGLIGFGTEAVTGFPINVPLGSVELKTLKLAKTIENTYALLMLRFGYLGCGFFILAAFLALYQLLKIADANAGGELQWFCASIGSFLFAVLLAQATVWMPHEIGFPLVWMFGVSSGLAYSEMKRRMSH